MRCLEFPVTFTDQRDVLTTVYDGDGSPVAPDGSLHYTVSAEGSSLPWAGAEVPAQGIGRPASAQYTSMGRLGREK